MASAEKPSEVRDEAAKVLSSALYAVGSMQRLAMELSTTSEHLRDWMRMRADAPGVVLKKASDLDSASRISVLKSSSF
jgi:hypothetical protein